jgi:hypothetical protein
MRNRFKSVIYYVRRYSLCVHTQGWTDLIELLKNAQRRVAFSDGLTDIEVARTEETYGFRFPVDLRNFLQTALPIGFPFPDWRAEDDPNVREMLRWPLHGILFDVEQNDFWLPEWGAKPSRIEDAKAIAKENTSRAPRLIPIYSHRMMPDLPLQSGNPVLSVYQTDIIYYGFDLDDYFRHEFELPGRKPWPSEIRSIAFWDVDRWQKLR